jgi:hypothetical protein
MTVLDFFLFPIYALFFYVVATRIKSRYPNSIEYQHYFLRGLTYKFIGSLGFASIYIFYYKGGDSLAFYDTMKPLYGYFFKNMTGWFNFVFSYSQPYPIECAWEAHAKGVGYLLRGSATLTTIRVGAVINMFCFNSYIVCCLFFAFLSYLFQWKLFLIFTSIYKTEVRGLAIAFLMIPSVLFWSSSVSKDSIMLSAIMYFIVCFYRIAILKDRIIRHIIFLFMAGFLISLIRGFILFTLIPCLMLMTMVYYRSVFRNALVRFVMGPILLVAGMGISFLFVQRLGESVDSYKLDTLEQKAEGFKSWHSYLGETQGGSGYSLGEVEYTPTGILRAAPQALIITLFGPFIWQIRSPVMLLSGIESLILLFVMIRTFFNKRIYEIFKVLLQDYMLAFSIPFIVILGIAIGLTSFNYGALVRYKIPVLPFFVASFYIIQSHLNRRTILTHK